MNSISETQMDPMEQFRNSIIGTPEKYKNFWDEYSDDMREISYNGEKIKHHTFYKEKETIYNLDCDPIGFKTCSRGNFFIVDNYKVTHVEDFGGEGSGDQYWYVCSVTHKDTPDDILVYYKHYGWYASYDGGYLEDVCEVKPKQVTVTEWV